jgi:transposase-like protein
METGINSFSGNRRFNRAQKEQILREHVELGVPISQLARKNGIHAVTIYQWKRQMKENDNSIHPNRIQELLLEIQNLKSQNHQLKIKVADLAVSNDILTDAIEIAKKRALLKQSQLLEKSKNQKNSV